MGAKRTRDAGGVTTRSKHRKRAALTEQLVFVCQTDAPRSEEIARLVRAGADVHVINSNGHSLLHHACAFEQEANVRALIDAGIDVNTVTALTRLTALHETCFWSSPDSPWPQEGTVYDDIARALLECGSDTTLTNVWGNTSAEYAALSGRADLAAFIDLAAPWSRLQHMCDGRRPVKTVRELLRSDYGRTQASTERALENATRVQPSPLALPVNRDLVEMMQRAASPWCPENHALFPASFRCAVRAVLFVMHRSAVVLPPELLFSVLSWLGPDAFSRL